jgi:hypothetical protein
MSGDIFTADETTKNDLVSALNALAACLAGNLGDSNYSQVMQGHMQSTDSLQAQILSVWKALPQDAWNSPNASQSMRAEFDNLIKIFAQWCTDGQNALQSVAATIQGQVDTVSTQDAKTSFQDWGHFHPE